MTPIRWFYPVHLDGVAGAVSFQFGAIFVIEIPKQKQRQMRRILPIRNKKKIAGGIRLKCQKVKVISNTLKD